MALTIVAGQIIRASTWNALVPLTVVRTSNLSRISNAILADDDTLVITSGIRASSTYRLGGFINFDASIAADFKIGWTCTGIGATLNWCDAGTAANLSEDHNLFTLSTAATAGGAGVGTPQTVPLFGYLNSGTGAGIAFKLQWCQGASDASNTTIRAGSQIELVPVA